MKSRLKLTTTSTLLLATWGAGCSVTSTDELEQGDGKSSGMESASGGEQQTSSGGAPTAGSGGSSTSAGGTEGSGGSGADVCSLDESGPITTTMNGQVIENLHVTSSAHRGIDVQHDDVLIRNVFLEHSAGKGIYVSGDNVRIENVHIEYTAAPDSGANSGAGFINIECNGGAGLEVEGARLERGSSGIYLVNCPSSHLSWIQGFDFRGPYPRGQVVQWNNSSNGILEDFSVVSPKGSWPEDNVNVYKSLNVTIRRGLVDGNNAPSGVGVIFDGGTSTGVVEDVDAIRMGNGCFSGYAAADDVTFRRTRCSDNICGSQEGRGEPKSNSLMWAGNPEKTDQKIIDSTYMNSCNGNISWPASAFSTRELEEESYTPRAPLDLHFCFD